VKVDPQLILECRKHYKKAYKILQKIEREIDKYCEQQNITLLFREDTFEPLWHINGDILMRYPAILKIADKNITVNIVVLKDGTIACERRENLEKDEVSVLWKQRH